MRVLITAKNKYGKILSETDITCINSDSEYYKIIDEIDEKFKEHEIWIQFVTNDRKDIIDQIYRE